MPFTPAQKRARRRRALNAAGARFIRSFRKRHGLTQLQAANVLKVTGITVSRWERGAIRVPPIVRLAVDLLEFVPSRIAKGRK